MTDNFLKPNPQKSHLLTNNAQDIQINIGEMAISDSKYEKLLGIHIDSKLTLDPHVRSLCKKVSQKLNVFGRIGYYLKFDQRKLLILLLRRLLLNAFITYQFSYAPDVSLFHNRKGRVLRIECQDHNSLFDELLAKSGSFKIHDQNF